jgi:mono/diheme cytochrome c family protein
MMFRASLFSLVAMFAAVAAAEQSTKKVTYQDDVKPIFRQHCFNCHHQGDKKGGLALDTYGSLIEGGGSGEVVYEDGDYESSRLWQLVSHQDTPVMPPNQDRIPDAQLAVIQAWIEGGVLENAGSKAKKKKKTSLAFTPTKGGKPEGPIAMPETMPLATPVVSDRAPAISALATSPWAPLAAIAGQNQIVLYNTDTNELLGILPFPEGIAQDLKFSRDGSYLIAGGGEHAARGLVVLFDVKTGERVAEIGDELDTVFGADANDTMSRIALGGPMKMLRIFDISSGEMLFDLKKHTDWIYTVAYSPDGVLLASGDRSGGVVVWEAETGRQYLDLTDHKGPIYSLAWRDDSNVLASASGDGTVKLWDMHEGKAVKTIRAHGGGVTSVKFDHEGRLVTGGVDNRAKLWDATGKELKSFGGTSEDVLEVAITHDGKRVLYGDWLGKVFSVSSEDPKDSVSLAANPAPAEERIKTVQNELASFQKKLAPVKAELDQALKAVEAAQKPLTDLDNKVAALKKQSAESESAAKKAEQTVAALDQQLADASATSRDLQDMLIAKRVGLKSGNTDLLAVAEAEEQLAKQLTANAQKRRQRIAAQKSIGEHRAAAKAKLAEADQLAAKRGDLVKKLEAAKAASAKIQQQHDEVAKLVSDVQSKIQRLTAATK